MTARLELEARMAASPEAVGLQPLAFPFQAPACDGSLVDVVPGSIKWLRMPLPMALDHINLYLVRDGAGWRMIDTGFDTRQTRALWEKILPGLDGPVTGIISTHHHGDHCGLAGWLTEKLRVPLYMSRAEYFAMRLFGEKASLDSWEYKEYFRRAGLSAEQLTQMAEALKQFHVDSPLARAYQRLRDGDSLVIGGREWQVRGGEGHSPEHCALHCPGLGVLLSGDQLLARISPNVGVLPFEPEANPLKDWFISLERIGKLPDDTLVLPAHELPFYGLGRRALELRQHHLGVLDRVLGLCADLPDSIFGLAQRLFPDRRSELDNVLAISETLAHLAFLLEQGRIGRSLTAAGSYEYRVAA
ncbi:MAG: MBL fold metallo-hydrolase [Betaproteobacteria bacterium]|nr:MBL fold metallo-hydrolase [Rhodocyclales bacterium]